MSVTIFVFIIGKEVWLCLIESWSGMLLNVWQCTRQQYPTPLPPEKLFSNVNNVKVVGSFEEKWKKEIPWFCVWTQRVRLSPELCMQGKNAKHIVKIYRTKLIFRPPLKFQTNTWGVPVAFHRWKLEALKAELRLELPTKEAEIKTVFWIKLDLFSLRRTMKQTLTYYRTITALRTQFNITWHIKTKQKMWHMCMGGSVA